MFYVGLLFVTGEMMMTTAEIKQKLYEEIDRSDARLLKMLYAMAKEYNSLEEEISQQRTLVEEDVTYRAVDQDITAEKRHAVIMEERAKFLNGERKAYSWDEVKEIAKSKIRTNEA